MTEPISTIIGALVSLFTAYTTYKVGMAQAAQNQQSAPDKTAAVQQGEEMIVPLKSAIQQHEQAREQEVLAAFVEDVAVDSEQFRQAMIDVAQRDQAFAAALQNIARIHGVVDQNGQVQINVEKGIGIGTMTGGTIHTTFN